MFAAVVTAVAGLWIARRAASAARGVLVVAFTGLLVSPISWSHHWVWCVPLLAVLLAEGRMRTAATVAVVFLARTLWLVPHEGDLDLRLPWWQQVPASPYPLLALTLALAMPVLAPAAGRARGRAPHPEPDPNTP